MPSAIQFSSTPALQHHPVCLTHSISHFHCCSQTPLALPACDYIWGSDSRLGSENFSFLWASTTSGMRHQAWRSLWPHTDGAILLVEFYEAFLGCLLFGKSGSFHLRSSPCTLSTLLPFLLQSPFNYHPKPQQAAILYPSSHHVFQLGLFSLHPVLLPNVLFSNRVPSIWWKTTGHYKSIYQRII